MQHFTLEEYRSRMDNLQYAQDNVKSYLKKVRIHDYLPGQVTYNLGEYPSRFSIRPTEYDYNLIKSLAEKGVGLIQIHEEWNDSQRLLGADKFTSHDEEGLKEFISLCHNFGIKILPYISSGFFEERDKDFTEKFTKSDRNLTAFYFHYRLCNSSSPEWNEYFMRKISTILDTYEFDGLYNDMGYDGISYKGETYENWVTGMLDYNPHYEDMLARIYSLVKERNGIVKIHHGYTGCPTSDEKLYDYLWVGECCDTIEELISTAKYNPYVIPCPDYRTTGEKNKDAYFIKTLPFLQFPLRVDGRPITGERAFVPGVEYIDGLHLDGWKKIKEFYDAHPDGPYAYGEWSSVPDDEEMREKWFWYLSMYKPMVTENSVVFVDIDENTITNAKLNPDIHMSLFINEDKYLCISNFGDKETTIHLNEKWYDRVDKRVVQDITLAACSMVFLKSI